MQSGAQKKEREQARTESYRNRDQAGWNRETSPGDFVGYQDYDEAMKLLVPTHKLDPNLRRYFCSIPIFAPKNV